MTIVIFILVLFILILVHEWGHFIVAKKSGIRVDEFGIGFPPKAVTLFKKSGTEYTLNWIPFGGFVKIFGENYEDVEDGKKITNDSFSAKSKWTQAAVLIAGVVMNFLLAWVLITIAFTRGVPASSSSADVENPVLTVLVVEENSPASLAGLSVGDSINYVIDGEEKIVIDSPEAFQNVVRKNENQDLTLGVERGEESLEISVVPEKDPSDTYASVGIAMDMIGIEKIPFGKSIVEGFKTSIMLCKSIITGFIGIFTGSTDVSSLSGPVGIASIVGEASKSGFTNLIFLMAVISLNLAVLNLIPFPALDGGRLLFILIESITKKPIPPKIFSITNMVGFFLLIGLMILVSIRDVIHLF